MFSVALIYMKSSVIYQCLCFLPSPAQFRGVFNGDVNTLLFFCVLSSVITTSVFFVEIYSTVSSPYTLSGSGVTAGTSAMVLVRKAFTPAVPLDPYDYQNHTEIHTNLSSGSRNLFTPASVSMHQHRHSTSVFKSWSSQVITRSSPSLGQNCSALFAGNSSEMKRVVKYLNKASDYTIFPNCTNCSQVLHEFYDNFYVSEKERLFPIAFTLVVHTNAQQTLRFLKAIYRSQNTYCIHPDLNSGQEFVDTFRRVSKCLPNVFVTSVIRKVDYRNTRTILEAQLSCLRDLEAQRRRKWKYVINLCSRELPLQTNRFIVEALSSMNGTSVLKAVQIDTHTLQNRFGGVRHSVASKAVCEDTNVECVEKNEDFLKDNSIKLYKSMAYNALSFEFVRYLLHNATMQQLTQWMVQHCLVPEEHLYATAYMMPGASGGFSESHNLPRVSKSLWKHYSNSHYYSKGESCSGRSVHQVCILSTADLPYIQNVVHWGVWFLNKYFMEEDHVVMDCVEELLVTANKQEFYGDYRLSLS